MAYPDHESLLRAAVVAAENAQAELTRVVCLADISTRSPETQALVRSASSRWLSAAKPSTVTDPSFCRDGIDFERRFKDNPSLRLAPPDWRRRRARPLISAASLAEP